ncbi:hypothetical protein Q9L58_009135 [Maublancomyces gigas]|uniref:Uncharacterized protein n=1 Tax=Discina gigas TaxID=1032678 RepID=A0ABR3G7R7_9PEZI
MAPLMAPPISSQSPPFSPEQLLALPLLTPPHALPSCFNFAGLSTDCRDRTSSKKTQNHDAIALQSLVKTDDSIIATFRSFVRSMSPAVSFPTSLMLPVHGRSMNSQGDVTSYLDFQVIAASWETFLQMMPVQRTYDPLTARQHPIEDGVPDQVFGALQAGDRGGYHIFQVCAIAEYTAPGVVGELVSLIDNMSQPTVEIPDDWVSITRRLRKYATNASVRDIVLMGESHVIYFRFPTDPTEDFETHEYLIASLAHPSAGDLSAREMITFLCWRSLLLKGFKLRDFAVEDVDEKNSATNEYLNVLPTPDLAYPLSKRKWDRVAEEEQSRDQEKQKPTTAEDTGVIIRLTSSCMSHSTDG